MQYCSLPHWTLLSSPVTSTTGRCFRFGSVYSVTSTTGRCFRFGSVYSFFLVLFLHSSPVAYWAHTDQGSSSFNVISFLPFHTVHGVLKARILKWFAIPFSSGPHSVRYHLFIYLLSCPQATLGHHQGTSERNTLFQNCGFFLFVSQKIHVSPISLRL